MYTKNRFINYAMLSLILLATSCDISYLEKEINEDITWDGSVRVSAGYVNYSLSEIFEELGSNGLEPTSTEEFSFSYTNSFVGQNNDAYDVNIDNTTINTSIATPITANELAAIGETFPYTITAEIAPGVPNPIIGTRQASNQVVHDLELTQEIISSSFNGGDLTITFSSTFDADIDLTIGIPSFTRKTDDVPFSSNVSINGNGQSTVVIDLNEYNANFTNDGSGFDNTINTIVLNLDVDFTFSAGNVLESSDTVSYNAILSNASYEVIYGDFKQEAFNVSSESIDLDGFFDNFEDGNIEFNNVSMSVTATNDYGFPIGVDLSSIQAINQTSSVNLTYTGDQSLLNTMIINGVENFGDSERVTNTTLNESNSNIQDLLELRPDEILLNVSGSANPVNTGTSNENFYAAINSGLDVEMTIQFDDISIREAIDFDDADVFEDFTDIRLLVNVENKIPLSGNVVLEFKDSSNQIVHTENLQVFSAANLNSSGESDGVAVSSSFEIDLTPESIQNISRSNTIDIILTLQLPDNENSVFIKGSDDVTITINAEVSGEISSDDN